MPGFGLLLVLAIAVHSIQLVLAFAVLKRKNWARLCTVGFAGIVVFGVCVLLSMPATPAAVRAIAALRLTNDIIVLCLFMRRDVRYFFEKKRINCGDVDRITPTNPQIDQRQRD